MKRNQWIKLPAQEQREEVPPPPTKGKLNIDWANIRPLPCYKEVTCEECLALELEIECSHDGLRADRKYSYDYKGMFEELMTLLNYSSTIDCVCCPLGKQCSRWGQRSYKDTINSYLHEKYNMIEVKHG